MSGFRQVTHDPRFKSLGRLTRFARPGPAIARQRVNQLVAAEVAAVTEAAEHLERMRIQLGGGTKENPLHRAIPARYSLPE